MHWHKAGNMTDFLFAMYMKQLLVMYDCALPVTISSTSFIWCSTTHTHTHTHSWINNYFTSFSRHTLPFKNWWKSHPVSQSVRQTVSASWAESAVACLQGSLQDDSPLVELFVGTTLHACWGHTQHLDRWVCVCVSENIKIRNIKLNYGWVLGFGSKKRRLQWWVWVIFPVCLKLHPVIVSKSSGGNTSILTRHFSKCSESHIITSNFICKMYFK